MRPGTKPHTVSSLLPYQHGTITNINAGSVIRGAPVCAGVSKDGGLSWITHGPVVEVVNTKTRNCLASWTFGAVLKDSHTSIASVAEYKCNQDLKLLLGVNNSSDNGMLCVFDVSLSKVVKAIEIPHKVTFVEPVTSVGGDYVPIWALNEQLRQFYGIVAVGTEGGFVYLIDMCVDEEADYSDEIMPNRLLFVTPRSRDVQQRRVQAVSKGQQLCMVLDEEAQCQGEYQYRRCDGTVLKLFNTEDVKVTCLKYIPQTGNLVVGFNFGCFQLWKLHIPVLEYSSRLEVDSVPVTHIAYQEPENDPKNFCYLWMARDPSEQQDEGVSTTSLYQLAYNKKTWYSNYGAFYEELTSVSLRFELELTSTPLTLSNKSTVSSRIVACYTLEDPNYSTPARLGEDESFEESVHGPDLSLCVTVWESSDGQSIRDTCHLAVFDMNRWYHAQMPATVRNIASVMDTCPYLACLSLEDAADVAAPDNIIAVHIGTERLRKFTNNSPMPPEQHFYPSSLAFEALMVTESGFVKASYLGTQRQVLASMNKMGPSILLNPKELYGLSVYMGLLPRPLDSALHPPAAIEMREMLLSLALDYNMISFLIKCVQQWAAGEYVHVGCTLKFLLDWAWDKVGTIKNIIDTTCTPLYDWSGITLDQRSVQTLYQCQQKLEYLTTLFKVLLNQAAPTTEQGLVDLQNKLCALTYVTQHLQMVLWFVRVGLLPERDDCDDRTDQQYSYPASNLVHAYRTKRQDLHKLHSDLADPDLLMIDGLLSHMGPAVRNLWSREGGDGLYPPPSLHALLSIYLLDDVDLVAKHSVVLYLLLDLVSLVNAERHQQFVDKISKFSKTFAIPRSVVKQVQGCWLLDHSDFEEALSVILDPMVLEEMGRWQHGRIIRALLYQGASKMALRYLSTAQPSLTSPEDVKLKLTVLLASGLTAEALEYQRTYRDQVNMHDLLFHLFLGCQQMKTMDQLLQLPLTEAEEHHLVRYLTESSEPHSQEVLVLHYLQRARYVEAIQLNEKLKQTVFAETSSKARERVAARNAIVDGFMSVLSGAQKKLIFENHNIPKKNMVQKREVKKPKPLSTTVTHSSHTRVVSQASLFLEVAEKVQEVKQEDTPEKLSEDPVGPFVCTPITPKPQSRLSLSQPVTYPKICKDSESGLKATPWRPAALSSLTPFSNSKSPSTHLSKRRSKIFGAEVLNMLETPKVQRRTPVKKQPSLSARATPQSILKVKRFLVRSPSSQLSPSQTSIEDTNQSSVSKPFAKKLGFHESSLPASPRTVSFVDTPKDVPSAPMPKHLHFSGVKGQRSQKGQRSPVTPPSPRSLKDRSPTPESISRSPKNFAKMDDLRRPPLHDERKLSHPVITMDLDDDDITFKFDTGDTNMTPEVDESTETFNTPSSPPGNVTAPSSEAAMQSSPLGGIIEGVDKLPASPELPAPYTSLRESHDSPLRLRQSPLVKSLPRSPTVKLSKSPIRGRYTPKYQQYEEGPSRLEEESVKEPSVTLGDKEEPIEIDLTEDEDMVSDDVKNVSMDDRVQSASQIISGSVSPSLKTNRLEAGNLESVPPPSERVFSEQSGRQSLFMEADSSSMEVSDSVAQVGQIRHVSFSTELVPAEEIEGSVGLQCASSSIDRNENANSQTDEVPEVNSSVLVQGEDKPLEITIPEVDSVGPPSPRKSPRLSRASEEAETGILSTTKTGTPPTTPKQSSKSSSASPKRSPKPRKEAVKDMREQLVIEVSQAETNSSPPSPRRSPRFTLQEDDSESPVPALSPRIPPTPPESGQDSPTKSQDTARKAKSISPTRISVVTPTRKSARQQKQEVHMYDTQANVNTDPVTPTRRSSRKLKEPVQKIEFEEMGSGGPLTLPHQESAKAADSSSQEPTTPTRRGRSKKKPDPLIDSTSQEPTTPTRRGRSRTQSTAVVDSKSQESTTPTRKSRQGSLQVEDNTMPTPQEPTTPTRRGRSKVQPTSDMKSEDSTILQKAITPTRQTRQSRLSATIPETVPSPQEPTTPTRRSRRGTITDTSASLEPTTPTRRGRTKAGDSTLHQEESVLKTPTCQSTVTTKTEEFVAASSFTFAEPVLMDFKQDEEVKPSTPLKSFIFSPPITRSRESFYRLQAARKRSSRELELKSETETMTPSSILLPPPPEIAPPPQPVPVKKEKKPTRKTKKKVVEEETIVLVSPIKEENDRPARRMVTRQRAKKEDVVPTKTLRGSEPGKASRLRSKRKPVKL